MELARLGLLDDNVLEGSLVAAADLDLVVVAPLLFLVFLLL